ncbi:L-lactate permease [Galactobacter sp.]|uniref:L-lactate permease n=1 Tax=Galactobacter sp. TaxID=2676125 RepID=UPI0025BF8CA1|nr:L-lactate permease [Galactobacter sp.]
MTSTTVDLILAALPMLGLVGMLAFRVRPARAALIAIGVALALFPLFPLTGTAVDEQAASLASSTLAVIFIMLGGILVSQMLEVSGAQERISDWLAKAARTRARTVLLLGLGVAPLAESIIGFGVGVVTTVPLLLRAGLNPTKAATIALLGIIMAPWGSMAPGMLLASGLSHLSLSELGSWSAVFNLPVQLVMGATILWVGVGAKKAVRKLPELLLMTAVMWGSLLAVSLWITPALAGIIASALGIVTLLLLSRIRSAPLPKMAPSTRRAFLPYALLIVCMLGVITLSRLVDLGGWETFLTSPGLWIMVTAAAAPFILRMGGTETGFALRRGVRTWFPACSVTLLFIVFGAVMATNGMSATLAEGAADLGVAFILLLPLIGAIGGYVTNSGSGSAALLTSGIAETTHALNADLGVALAAQNVATGAAIMACPARITVAEAMANNGAGAQDTASRADTGWITRVVLLADLVVLAILTPMTAWLLLS